MPKAHDAVWAWTSASGQAPFRMRVSGCWTRVLGVFAVGPSRDVPRGATSPNDAQLAVSHHPGEVATDGSMGTHTRRTAWPSPQGDVLALYG